MQPRFSLSACWADLSVLKHVYTQKTLTSCWLLWALFVRLIFTHRTGLMYNFYSPLPLLHLSTSYSQSTFLKGEYEVVYITWSFNKWAVHMNCVFIYDTLIIHGYCVSCRGMVMRSGLEQAAFFTLSLTYYFLITRYALTNIVWIAVALLGTSFVAPNDCFHCLFLFIYQMFDL